MYVAVIIFACWLMANENTPAPLAYVPSENYPGVGQSASLE